MQEHLGIQSPHAHPLTMARNSMILLRPEDIRARLNHQPTVHSHRNLQVILVITRNGNHKLRQAIPQKQQSMIIYALHRDTYVIHITVW